MDDSCMTQQLWRHVVKRQTSIADNIQHLHIFSYRKIHIGDGCWERLCDTQLIRSTDDYSLRLVWIELQVSVSDGSATCNKTARIDSPADLQLYGRHS